MKLLTRIKTFYANWKSDRFLKKHGCDTWQEYHHRFDPGINLRATQIDEYYCGYPYWHVMTDRNCYAYTLLYDYGPGGFRYGYYDIVDWCKENLKHKHRTDLLRVVCNKKWYINELSGSDCLFFAFKEEKDYIWFLMKWS